jgi:hypothetical protein
MAQALVNARRRDEARRWCDEALMAARGAGSADEEADVLITLGMIEQYDDPAGARSRFAAARAQAADAGNPEVEVRALYDLAEVGSQLWSLAAARAGFDDGVELAQRAGLGWSDLGLFMRRGQLRVRYRTGDWDGCERLLRELPEPVMTLAAAQVVASGLGVLVARGRPDAPELLRRLVRLAGDHPALDRDVAASEAELATWQGDLERARLAVQRGLAAADAVEVFDQALEGAWVSMKGLTVQADRAERARAAGDAATLADAAAAGGALLDRVRAAVERAHRSGLAHDVHLRGRHAKAEAEWTGSRVAPTRRAGRPPSKPSPMAMSARRRAASGCWRRRWPAPVTATGDHGSPGGACDRDQARSGAAAGGAGGTGPPRSPRPRRRLAGAADVGRSDPTRARGVAPAAGGALQPPDRRAAVHQQQDGQRARDQPAGQAGRA